MSFPSSRYNTCTMRTPMPQIRTHTKRTSTIVSNTVFKILVLSAFFKPYSFARMSTIASRFRPGPFFLVANVRDVSSAMVGSGSGAEEKNGRDAATTAGREHWDATAAAVLGRSCRDREEIMVEKMACNGFLCAKNLQGEPRLSHSGASHFAKTENEDSAGHRARNLQRIINK